MKNEKSKVSKSFWMIMTIMLSAFILVSGVIVICVNAFTASHTVTTNPPETSVTQSNPNSESSTSDSMDRFEATKDRVNEINDNYGQNVKSSYSGSESAFEQMMRQRMIMSTVKNVLFIALIAIVILPVLVKGFNLKLFKKNLIGAVAGDADSAAEEPASTSDNSTEPSSDPDNGENDKADEAESAVQSDDEENTDIPAEEAGEPEIPKAADDEEVTESCQLP